jgi:hypothetical protein
MAPPPPPSANPEPVVVEPGTGDPTALGTFRGVLEPWELGPMARSRNLEWLERGWASGYAWPDHPATDVAGFLTSVDSPDPRLASFRAQWGATAQGLLMALARGFAAGGGLAFGFPAPRS